MSAALLRALLLLSLALPGACALRSTRPPSAAAQALGVTRLTEREARLNAVEQFRLQGRIAISDGKDSGSGGFDWDQRASTFTLSFTAPVTAQNWRLDAQPGQAVLSESNGAVRVAANTEQLLERELHWQLPADAMRYWVLGIRAPGSDSTVEFDADGELALLRQNGWEIRYPSFDLTQDPPVPNKVFARNGDNQVRISVRRWTFP